VWTKNSLEHRHSEGNVAREKRLVPFGIVRILYLLRRGADEGEDELAFRPLQSSTSTVRWCCSQRQTKFSKEINMRRIGGGLCLLATLAISLLAAPLYANESAAPKRTVIASRYDVTKEVTLTGTVQSLVRKPAPGTIMGAHLMVSTSQGTVDAHIGNHLLAGKSPMSFAAGQSVKLVGLMTTVNHQNVFLVRTIQMENRTITVRSDHGFLVGHGATPRITGVSSTGGAR
jgi:hypothetical protein